MPDTSIADTPAVDIQLDVFDIDQTTAFWSEGLGFEIVGEPRRPGTLLESRTLARPDTPEVRFTFSSCKPRPVSASAKGSIRVIALRVADVDAVRQKLEQIGAELVSAPGNTGAEHSCRVLDPNGYLVELRGDPRAGS